MEALLQKGRSAGGGAFATTGAAGAVPVASAAGIANPAAGRGGGRPWQRRRVPERLRLAVR
eukprot:11195342-Lingulodinium_polyedra.AAC.1